MSISNKHLRVTFSLTPSESKRLIAKGVAALDEVRRSLERAYTIIGPGTTNAFVAQEVFGLTDLRPETFAIGISSDGLLCITDPAFRARLPLVAYKGDLTDKKVNEAIEDFHLETAIIKGGNAIDHDGNVGVVLGGFTGGGVGETVGTVVSQGLNYIVPIGLEKMVPSVKIAAAFCGAKRFDYSMGADFGLMILPNAIPITEIKALEILFGVKAVHVASGGIGDSTGAVTLVAEGKADAVQKTMDVIETIKGEPPVPGAPKLCSSCRYDCVYTGENTGPLPNWLKIHQGD